MRYDKFTFFWGGPLSQWSESPFVIDGILYPTAEHYMMWYKDQVFSGGKMAKTILRVPGIYPSVVKELGKKVEGFDLRVWQAVAKAGVLRGNLAKFSQNREHFEELMSTRGTLLVEASSTDTVWGVGLEEDDPLIMDPKNWRGTNWLGEILTEVRDALAANNPWV